MSRIDVPTPMKVLVFALPLLVFFSCSNQDRVTELYRFEVIGDSIVEEVGLEAVEIRSPLGVLKERKEEYNVFSAVKKYDPKGALRSKRTHFKLSDAVEETMTMYDSLGNEIETRSSWLSGSQKDDPSFLIKHHQVYSSPDSSEWRSYQIHDRDSTWIGGWVVRNDADKKEAKYVYVFKEQVRDTVSWFVQVFTDTTRDLVKADTQYNYSNGRVYTHEYFYTTGSRLDSMVEKFVPISSVDTTIVQARKNQYDSSGKMIEEKIYKGRKTYVIRPK